MTAANVKGEKYIDLSEVKIEHMFKSKIYQGYTLIEPLVKGERTYFVPAQPPVKVTEFDVNKTNFGLQEEIPIPIVYRQIPDGKYREVVTTFSDDGKLFKALMTVGYKNGFRNGEALLHNKEGKLVEGRIYDDGQIVEQTHIKDNKGYRGYDFKDGWISRINYLSSSEGVDSVYYASLNRGTLAGEVGIKAANGRDLVHANLVKLVNRFYYITGDFRVAGHPKDFPLRTVWGKYYLIFEGSLKKDGLLTIPHSYRLEEHFESFASIIAGVWLRHLLDTYLLEAFIQEGEIKKFYQSIFNEGQLNGPFITIITARTHERPLLPATIGDIKEMAKFCYENKKLGQCSEIEDNSWGIVRYFINGKEVSASDYEAEESMTEPDEDEEERRKAKLPKRYPPSKPAPATTFGAMQITLPKKSTEKTSKTSKTSKMSKMQE